MLMILKKRRRTPRRVTSQLLVRRLKALLSLPNCLLMGNCLSRGPVADPPVADELEEVTREPTVDSPARARRGDPAAEKDELQEHNRVKALQSLLTDVVMAVVYLLGLKRYN